MVTTWLPSCLVVSIVTLGGSISSASDPVKCAVGSTAVSKVPSPSLSYLRSEIPSAEVCIIALYLVHLTGSDALDIDPPSVTIDTTKQDGNHVVTISAEETSSGLKDVYYSLDGTTFHPYASPVTITPNQASYVYAFADDNAGNRSSLVKRRLPIRSALLVSGSSTLTPSDLFVSTHLEDLGYSVSVKSAESSVTTDATGKDLVVISSTVEPSVVNTKFRDVTAGVLKWDEGMFPYLG